MNRLFGTLCALAFIAVMAFAVLNWGNYQSMCFAPTTESSIEMTESEPIEPIKPIAPEDSTILEEVAPLEEPSIEEVE